MRAAWMAVLVILLGIVPGIGYAQPSPAESTGGRRIALVIGVSSYPRLDAGLTLDSARSDAARVAAALEGEAGFDEVRLLTDASASMSNVETVIREQVSREVQWRDLFLVYFVGHGVGGDFGDPRLLLYDADPDALEATTLTVGAFAGMLQKFVPASRYIVVTDAAHAGTFNGLALLGPTGNDWPALSGQSFVISSTAPRQVATPGVFASAFIEAMTGHADTDVDGVVTASELNNYLVVSVPGATKGAQLPTVQSTYPPAMVITERRAGAPAVSPLSLRVDKAKFVFQRSTDPHVLCQGMAAPRSCDPSCYVWDVSTGPCRLTVATPEGELSTQVSLLSRGGYTCGVYDRALQCAPMAAPR